MSAALDLQRAVFQALADDAGLTAALGGPGRLHDRTPPKADFPYVTFGRTSLYDWSTGTELGSEHLFTLHVWSKAKGRTEVLTIMDAIGLAVDEMEPAFGGSRLVNLTLDYQEARYDDDLAVTHGLMRYRAVTEQA